MFETQLVRVTIYSSWFHQPLASLDGVPQADRAVIFTPEPGEEDLGLVDALAQLSFAIHGALGRISASHDMSIVQARLLGILRDRRPTIKELAGLLGLEKSSVTGLIDRAEDRGLVRRVASPIDGRSVQVVITHAGRKLVECAAAEFESDIGELVTELTSVEKNLLSVVASRIVSTDARRRGISLFDTSN
jgi:MarR family transcriptional regulator, lower aerobic nicotinate degradation pathway regulator